MGGPAHPVRDKDNGKLLNSTLILKYFRMYMILFCSFDLKSIIIFFSASFLTLVLFFFPWWSFLLLASPSALFVETLRLWIQSNSEIRHHQDHNAVNKKLWEPPETVGGYLKHDVNFPLADSFVRSHPLELLFAHKSIGISIKYSSVYRYRMII